ncbi:Chemotaxis protein CheA [Gammaproteobacteria bacterium]
MSIDLSMFHAAFFEETTEHLAEMERLLISLDLQSPEPDALNAIFRAAHSIKGGSGTFGFNDMTELTHVLESLLDRLRKDTLRPTPEMVNVFLASVDIIHDQLEAHRTDQIVDPAAAKAIIQSLETFMTELPMEIGNSLIKRNANDESLPLHHWRLRFFLQAGTTELGLNSLLDEWAQSGAVTVKQRPGDAASEMNWEIDLVTRETSENIREDLAFYADPSQIQVESVQETASELDPGYGFFAPLPDDAPVSNPDSEDNFFGFFADAPGAPSATPTQPDGASVTVAPNGAPDPNPKSLTTTTPASLAVGETRPTARKSEGSSIRVSVEKVDQIMNLVGELVIAQSMLAQVASQLDPVWTVQLQAGLDQLERNTRNLQESVMSIRMMPISVVFSRFPRLVRDLAAKLGKRVELITLGEGTELDKGLTEKLTDPLTHLIRNSLDHGVESPETRVGLGKDPLGHIILEASHQGGNVVIEVRDDGAGLNRARILAKARESGLAVNDGMLDQEVWQLIFAPGFSTAEQVTDVSGRGVGMDVVRRNIQEMGGTVDITSMQGVGSTFTVRLPLTLAILDGLSVGVGGEIFIISLGYIMESMRPRAADIRTISGRGQVVQVRGEYLPVLPLHEVFRIIPNIHAPEEGILVLLEAEGRRIALFVDQLVGQHQVVIKSLESNFRRVDGISGATIMGDGRVALILDVGYLVRRAARAG